jgi:XRE family transcriptional regulator, regulator of sulfur utilization
VSNPSPTSEQVGRVVRALREARGDSQETVADAAEISRYYFSEIELGVRNPTLFVLACIARALDVELSEVIKRAEDLPR